MTSNLIFVGVKAHVAAIDRNTGATVWQTRLKGSFASGHHFVTLLIEDGRVFAHTCGEVFCLNAATGEILWSNGLDGLGYDIGSLATEEQSASPSVAREQYREEEARRSNHSTGS